MSPNAKRKPPWTLIVVVLLVLAVAAYLIVPGIYVTSADGLVQGDLVSVSPIFRVRVDRLLVGCSDTVHAGETVAVVSNFLAQADYEREYQQSEAQLQFSEIAMEQGVTQAQTNVEILREKYEASNQDADRLMDNYRSYTIGYRAGAISKFDWESKRQEMLSSVASAKSDFAAWQLAKQQVDRIKTDDSQRISKNQDMTSQAQGVANRLGHEDLVAPVSGYVVRCFDRPETVIDPGKELLAIFEPSRAYVIGYFDPRAVTHLYLGKSASVALPGVRGRIDGKISSIYPNLTKLPNELTRFFWQKEQWAQYRPVKILFTNITPSQRAQLYYGAQVRISTRNE